MNNQISDAKSRLLIPALMRRLGVPLESIPKHSALPGKAQSVRCPWLHRHSHRDSKPSCSIYAGGTRIHCFVCGYDLDGPAFLKQWKSIPNAQAIKDFIGLAADKPIVLNPSTKIVSPKMVCADLHPLSEADKEQIARDRVIDVAAVRWACELGVLGLDTVCSCRSWVLVDTSKRIAEARRIGGLNFPGMANLQERKAHTLKGSDKSWPIGASLLHQYSDVRAIMLVEGGPDFLAALHFLHLFNAQGIIPIAMLGKAEIHPDAVRLIRGLRARIYPHNDPDGGGLKAANQWAVQLRQVGCQVDLFRIDGLSRTNGQPVKDLNDLTTIDAMHLQNPDQLLKLQSLLP